MKRFSVDKKISPRSAAACMMGCAFLWSTSGALIKLIDWNGMVITCLRSLVAAAALCVYLRLLGKKLVLNRLTMTTAIAVCIKYICFVLGNKLTSSANMVALQYTNPVFVLVISILIFHKKVKRKDILVAVATAAGIAMLTLDHSGTSSAVGNLMGLAVGLTTSIMYLMSARSASYEESLSIITLGHIYTAVLMSPFLFLSKITFTPQNVSSLLLLGLLQQAVAYALFSFSTRSAPPLTCSLIACINPLLNPVWTAVLLHEIPGPVTIAGFVIVLGSITLWSVSNAKEKTKTLVEQDASLGC
ncbi:MAG TPA: DMT family transporter [Clostridia bacterium]|nr:DMT family transporter [Clostridia bacterium]